MTKKPEEINPFVSSFVIYAEYKGTSERIEHENVYKQITYTLVDVDRKSQVYHRGTFEIMAQVSGNARLLFIYIVTHLGWEAEKVELKPDKMVDICNFSRSSYYRALEELRTMSIIVPSVSRKDMYWVNPTIVFNGSRMKVFPDNIHKPSTTGLKEAAMEQLAK